MATANTDEHARNVERMFGRIVPWYDFLNHFLSFGQDYYWRYRLAKIVRSSGAVRVLDLAAGTLDVALEITRQQPEAEVLAMDFTLPMLLRGQKKIKKNRKICCVQADARWLPLPDACVDAVTIAFGIRNILPRNDAFKEMHRVLASGGKAGVLEFGSGRKRIFLGLYNLYLKHLLPRVARWFAGDALAYEHLSKTILTFPTASELAEELLAAGFDKVTYVPLLQGICYLHVAEKASTGMRSASEGSAQKDSRQAHQDDNQSPVSE